MSRFPIVAKLFSETKIKLVFFSWKYRTWSDLQGSQCFPKMHLESMRLDAGTGAVIGMGVASDASVSSSFDVTVAGGACSDPSLEEHPNSAEDSNSGSTLLKQVLTTYLLPQKPGEAGKQQTSSLIDSCMLQLKHTRVLTSLIFFR